jgi:integrase/recombinase XerC/integrase/recombinase XerD
MSLAEIREAYIRHVRAHHAEKPQTIQSYEMGLDDVLDFLEARGIKRVVQVEKGIISQFQDTRLSEPRDIEYRRHGKVHTRQLPPLGARTVNIHVGAFKAMLRWAAGEGGLIDRNPVADMKPLKVKRRRKQRRAMTAAEKRKLLDASPEPLSSVWYVFLHTGLRHNELRELTWECVDLDAGRIIVSADFSKNSELGYVPLAEGVWQLLSDMYDRRQSDPHVFLNPATGRQWPQGDLSRRFNECIRTAGITKQTSDGSVDVHALRVTFITDLVRAGHDIKTVQKLARHKSSQVTLEYYARAGGDKVQRSAVESIAMPLPLSATEVARSGNILETSHRVPSVVSGTSDSVSSRDTDA